VRTKKKWKQFFSKKMNLFNITLIMSSIYGLEKKIDKNMIKTNIEKIKL